MLIDDPRGRYSSVTCNGMHENKGQSYMRGKGYEVGGGEFRGCKSYTWLDQATGAFHLAVAPHPSPRFPMCPSCACFRTPLTIGQK